MLILDWRSMLIGFKVCVRLCLSALIADIIVMVPAQLLGFTRLEVV
jgi:hypothetical protein